MTKKSDATVDISEIQKKTAEQYEQDIADLTAKVKAGEDAALDRVCKALNITPTEVKEKEKPEMMVRCFVATPVRVNMQVFQGDVTVPYGTFQVIQQAIGDRRMRLLRELTQSNYVLQELQGGGFAPKLVAQYNESGERIK